MINKHLRGHVFISIFFCRLSEGISKQDGGFISFGLLSCERRQDYFVQLTG